MKSLIKREPLKLFGSFGLWDEIDQWDNLHPTFPIAKNIGVAIPKIDASEDDKAFYVEADVHGVDKDKIDVTFNDNILRIEGKKDNESEVKEKNYIRKERSYSSFSKEIAFNADIDESNIKAEYKNGVLKLTIPKIKAVEKTAKKISVE